MSHQIEIKPTTFARGVPKEEHNGFYGIEEKLLALPIDRQITAVVTFRFEDDITKKGKGVRYPVIAIDHIEPIWDEAEIETAKEVQQTAYKERTGANQLDLNFDVEKDEAPAAPAAAKKPAAKK
jgi:hypothetical protein